MRSLPAMNDTRAYPHDLAAERALLGQVYCDPEAATIAREVVKAAQFYDPGHRKLFGLLCRMVDDGIQIDDVTVCDEINRAGGPLAYGGFERVFTLADETPTTANVRHYSVIVRDKYMQRSTLAMLEGLRAKCHGNPGDITGLVSDVAASLGSLLELGTTSAGVTVQDASDRLMTRQAAVYRGEVAPSMRTGFPDLDRLVSLKGGDVCVLAARPGVGKTGLALSLALYWANEFKLSAAPLHVVFFSLEMPATQLVARLCSDVGQIPGEAFRQRPMSHAEMDRYTDAHNEVRELPLHIFDRSGLTIQEMRAQAMAYHRRHPVGIVLVDYVQLIRNEEKSLSSVERIGEASKGVKEMAKDLGVPVVLLAQVNREGGQRSEVQISDLKGAGSLEEDADQIILMTRPGQSNTDLDQGVVHIKVGKNRHGSTGSRD